MEASGWAGKRPAPDLSPADRTKRPRPSNQELDIELDNYFRTKRFMTETMTKEMEDVAIGEPPVTTSPSRTSTLARLAEKGPMLSGTPPVIDFDAPKITVSGNNGRRRQLIVTSAGDVRPQWSDLSVEEVDEDEEEPIEDRNGTIEWRITTPKPSIPKPIEVPGVEDALQRLIEKKKKETDAKSLVLYRSPSDIIKGAAQQAILAKVKSRPLAVPAPSPFGRASYHMMSSSPPQPSSPPSSHIPLHYFESDPHMMMTSPPLHRAEFGQYAPSPDSVFYMDTDPRYPSPSSQMATSSPMPYNPTPPTTPPRIPGPYDHIQSPPPFGSRTSSYTHSPPPPTFSMFNGDDNTMDMDVPTTPPTYYTPRYTGY